MARKPKAAPKPTGRPTKRTAEVERRIVDGLSRGTPLTIICGEEGMPDYTTVWRWAENDEELSQGIARAREEGFDKIAMEAMEIMDAPPERVIVVTGEDRSAERIDGAAVQWAKNRADLRMKLLSKWDPKRYGDAVTHKHADADGEKLKADDTTSVTRLAALVAGIQSRAEDAPDDAG